jgi:hypothetical protein
MVSEVPIIHIVFISWLLRPIHYSFRTKNFAFGSIARQALTPEDMVALATE